MAKQTLSILLISLVITAPVYADVSRSIPGAIPAVNTQPTQDHDRSIPHVARLSGFEAKAHTLQVQAKHPAAFGRVNASLAKRGFHPTDLAFAVVHSSTVSTAEHPKNGIQNAQDALYGTNGEIDFWSWDDGYDGTWEGVIYAENYNTGVSATFEAQINIEVDGNYWTVFENCTGVERYGQPYEVKGLPGGAQDSGIRLASLRAESEFLPLLLSSMKINQAPGKPYALVGGKAYYGCAFWGCLGAAVGCLFFGPGAPLCFIAACTTVLVACLGQLF